MPEDGKFSALVMELVGSKMANDMVREVIATATPEAKARLGAEVCAKISAQLKDNLSSTWDIGSVLQEEIRQEVGRQLPAYKEKIAAEVTKRIEAQFQKATEDMVRDALVVARRTFIEAMNSKLRSF